MSQEVMIKYPIKIKVISPTHIGTGNEYYPYEYEPFPNEQKVEILDIGLLIQKYPDKLANIFPQKEIRPFWQLVNESYWMQVKKDFIRNIDLVDTKTANDLKNWAEKGNAATIWEFMKNSKSEPYIPGSSIKGAIRTAIAYNLLKQSQPIFNKVKSEVIKKDKDKKPISYPGKKDIIENSVFRDDGDSQQDLMRLWSFSDSKPLPKDESLSIVVGKRLSKRKILGFRNYYEVLTEKCSEIELTASFFSSLTKTSFWGNRLSNFPQTLDSVFNCINSFVDDIIEWELDYFKKHPAKNQFNEIVEFYEDLKKRRQNGEILLPIGKGTGWIKKTVGLLFKKDNSGIFKDIFYAYRLGKKRQQPESFSSSREIIEGVKKEVFGWVQLKKG